MQRPVVALSALFAATALFCADAAFAQTATRIGSAAAVRNDVTGQQTGQPRRLTAGAAIFQNETIRTGVDSIAQLLFADQTTLSVGPRSQVRLDNFVYDANRTAGDVAVSFGSGALRFITGNQDPRNYQVRTPVATIGVRGTIVDLLLIDGRMFGILDEGRVIFTLENGQTVELNEPGTAVEFLSDGSVTRPFTWRGRYEASLGAATFPLFGNPFADMASWEGATNSDDATNRTEILDADLYNRLGQGQ
ncbi:MAG: FecR domain-containing protein [Hyphomonadaceae bacterium]|nr:FecR domain-containing protein [Hyphomonadaceae bacterium]